MEKPAGGVCHPKCLGKGFDEKEQEFLKGERDSEGKLVKAEECDRSVLWGAPEGMIAEHYCTAYLKPDLWWRPEFHCPLASHYKPGLVVKKGKINPLKASKRGGRR